MMQQLLQKGENAVALQLGDELLEAMEPERIRVKKASFFFLSWAEWPAFSPGDFGQDTSDNLSLKIFSRHDFEFPKCFVKGL